MPLFKRAANAEVPGNLKCACRVTFRPCVHFDGSDHCVWNRSPSRHRKHRKTADDDERADRMLARNLAEQMIELFEPQSRTRSDNRNPNGVF